MIDTEPLQQFIRHNFLLAKDVDLTDDQELFPSVIDPQGVVILADFVEETYGIRLSEEDMVAYAVHFRSLKTITALIERKRV
jgi:acyl carrier protein